MFWLREEEEEKDTKKRRIRSGGECSGSTKKGRRGGEYSGK